MHGNQQLGSEFASESSTISTSGWYALQTRHQCEKRVDHALRDEGFDTFAPFRLEKRQWSDRTKLIEAPLFPGYTFVHTDTDPRSLVRILRFPGVVRFVTNGREFVPVQDIEVETVRALAQSEASFETGPFPAVGERIRIRGGCLDGVEGVLTSQPSRREIVVSIGAIQRSLKVPLGTYRVERLS
jgi:transcription antitermination factor NusG